MTEIEAYNAISGIYLEKFHETVMEFRNYIPLLNTRKGKLVEVRTEPKINRNTICPKCESGLKYKKCCGK